MLNVIGAADLLQVVTSTTNAAHVQASWVDLTTATGATTPDRKNTIISSAATTTVVASPGAGVVRNVKHLSIHAEAGAQGVSVMHTDGSTAVQIVMAALLVSETLTFTDGLGWQIIDATGSPKVAGRTGLYLKTTVLTSGTSFTTGPNTNTIFVRVQGPGGGGGGVALNAAGNATVGGGGAAGSYAEKTFAVTPNTTYTYAIGAGGTAGASGGGTGGNAGGATTFTVGAVTVTAPSGLGGTFRATLATDGFTLGGASGAQATNGDLNSGGCPGLAGHVNASGVAGLSGQGGASDFGSGGEARIGSGVGLVGKGYGSGGSGALSLASGAAQAGGAGLAGVIVVDEFA